MDIFQEDFEAWCSVIKGFAILSNVRRPLTSVVGDWLFPGQTYSEKTWHLLPISRPRSLYRAKVLLPTQRGMLHPVLWILYFEDE